MKVFVTTRGTLWFSKSFFSPSLDEIAAFSWVQIPPSLADSNKKKLAQWRTKEGFSILQRIPDKTLIGTHKNWPCTQGPEPKRTRLLNL